MHPENIRVGQWVVVTNKKPVKRQPLEMGQVLIPIPQGEDAFEPSGIPIKVRAISLPFIAGFPAIAPNAITAIDISRYEVRAADKKYVQVFKDHYNLHQYLTRGGQDGAQIG